MLNSRNIYREFIPYAPAADGGDQYPVLADAGVSSDACHSGISGYAMGYLSGYGTTGALTLPDVGGATDSVRVAVAAPLPDTGATTDSLLAAAPGSFTESGRGTDNQTVYVTTPLSDTSIGADNMQPSVPDSGSIYMPFGRSAVLVLKSGLTTAVPY